MNSSLYLLTATVLGLGLATQAGAVPVASFTGTYDEATGVEAGGDYDNIGGASDIGDFALVAGVNTFLGSIASPQDSSDAFNIVIGANQTLVGATLSFGDNVDGFNPYFGFPSPTWGLYESSVTPTIFEFNVPDANSAFSAFTSTQTFTRGPGIYNMLFGNGVFGTNNGPAEYTMTFTVTENAPPPVPLPAAGWLLLASVGGLAAFKGRRRKTS